MGHHGVYRVRAAIVILWTLIFQASAEHGGDEFKNWPERHGAWVESTQGEVWPQPREQTSQEEFLVLRSNSFRFQVTSEGIHGPCDIINTAIQRYSRRVFPPAAANVFSHLEKTQR